MGVSYSVLSNKKLITITTSLVQVCPNVHTVFFCRSLAALPPVFVPTNVHHDIPAVLPSLAEDTLPENVILPSGDPPQAFPGKQNLYLIATSGLLKSEIFTVFIVKPL